MLDLKKKKKAGLCTKYFVTWSHIKMMSAKWRKEEPVLNHLIFQMTEISFVIILYCNSALSQIAKCVFPKKFDWITPHLLSYLTVLSLWEILVIKIGYNSFLISLFSDVSSFPSLITLLKCKPEDDTSPFEMVPPNSIALQINCLFSLACGSLYSLTLFSDS